MRKFIYYKFLNDKNIYEQNRSFWIDTIKATQPNSYEWMKNEFKNGVKIYDGNPLVSFKYENIAIRIIQIGIDKTIPKLMIWEKKYDEINVNEIVIHIQPYLDVYKDIEHFIKLFFKNRYRRTQKRLNSKYYTEFSNTRKNHMIKVLKELEEEKSPYIVEMKLSPNKAKIIKMAARKLPILKTRLENAKLIKKYNKTARAIFSISYLINKKLTRLEIKKVNIEIKEIKEGLEEISKS